MSIKKHLAEQMREFSKLLEEIENGSTPVMPMTTPRDDKPEDAHKDYMPVEKLKGTMNIKMLGDILHIHDMPMFNRAINKIRNGRANKLTSRELTQMAIAFVRLLDADAIETRQALNQIRLMSKVEQQPEPDLDEAVSGLEEAGKPYAKHTGGYGHSWTDIPKDKSIERSAGMFLITSRYQEGSKGYKILKEVSPEAFYSLFNLPARGEITVQEIGDLLVRAFDYEFDRKFIKGLETSTLWAFRDLDGHLITQHST